MGNLLKLFGFWGSSDLELPVLSSPRTENITANQMELITKFVYEGSEGPVTDIGFVYSQLNSNPEIGGANVTQVTIAPVPGPTPIDFSTVISGLTDTTVYYWKAYAINSAGTVYTPVQQVETNWDALTLSFLPSTSSNFHLLEITSNTNTSQVKVKLPDGSVQIGNAIGTSGVYLNLTDVYSMINPGDYLTVAIAPTTGSTFEGFTLENTNTNYANPKLLHWGNNQWLTLYHTFYGTNLYSYADDHPDLSQCTATTTCFYNRGDMFSNGVVVTDSFGTREDIGQWDMSNVQNTYGMFMAATNTDFGRWGVVDLADWDLSSCTDMSNMFKGNSNMGEKFGNPVPDGGLNIENWTLNSDATAYINMQEMFMACSGWSPGGYAGKGDIFDLNAATAVTKIHLTDTFNGCNNLCSVVDSTGINLQGWIAKIGNLTGTNAAGTEMVMQRTFRNVGLGGAGAKIDFTGINLFKFENLYELFYSMIFDPSGPNWATMLTNQDWTGVGGNVNENKTFFGMFRMVTNPPPLTNWNFNGVNSFQYMFAMIRHDASALPPGYILDLSTWKAAIDANDGDSTDPNSIDTYSYMFYYNPDDIVIDPNTQNRGVPLGIETWTFNSAVWKNFGGMCMWAKRFNRNIAGWDMSKVTDATYLLYYAEDFNNAGVALNWTLPSSLNPNGTGLYIPYAFYYVDSFNADISTWNMEYVTSCKNMLRGSGCTAAFNQDLSSWTFTANALAPDGLQQFQAAGGNWSTANFDATIIGWAKNILTQQAAGLGVPLNITCGFDTGCSTQPSCLPAASGGPYNVPADIVSAQDAIEYLTVDLGWSFSSGPCV